MKDSKTAKTAKRHARRWVKGNALRWLKEHFERTGERRPAKYWLHPPVSLKEHGGYAAVWAGGWKGPFVVWENSVTAAELHASGKVMRMRDALDRRCVPQCATFGKEGV